MVEASESEINENKTSLSEWKDGAISLAAFATSGGGTVHFGISPEGKRVGVQIGKNTIENLANDIRRHTDPPIFPSITVEGDESSALVHVTVEESPIKPVWAFGKPYKRVGRTNQSLSREETQRLVEATTGRTWDALPCASLREEHLSRAAVEDFLKRSGQGVTTPTSVVLENLYLILGDGRLSNAAALLFAKDPSRHVMDAYVRCGRFRGDEAVDFIDEMDTKGNLFEQLDQALAFVTRNTRQAIKITGKPQRERVPEYPDAAIREAISNAICHRNYAGAGHVEIRIFHSSLEVWNPGTLPHDLSLEDLYQTHHSRPRNKLIANVFHRAGLIERWGTGTLRIIEACEERGMSRPDFRSEKGLFKVRFVSKGIEGKVKVPAQTLTDRQRRTLEHVRKQGGITTAEYQSLFGVKERQARNDLRELVDDNHLRVEGRGRLTRYVLPESAG
jgi:ATP-dependent DNA helicase RecG